MITAIAAVLATIGAIVAAYVAGKADGAKKQIINAAVSQAAAATHATAARDKIALELQVDVQKTNAMDDQELVDSLNADFASVQLRHTDGKTPAK